MSDDARQSEPQRSSAEEQAGAARERLLRSLLDAYSIEANFPQRGANAVMRERHARSLMRGRSGFADKLATQIQAMRLVRSATFKNDPFIWDARARR